MGPYMSVPAPLIDRSALLRQRARQQRSRPDFLQIAALEDLQDRLLMVTKAFTDMVIITADPEIWAAAYPQARVISDDDVLDLAPNSCDLIVHALALHWANDPLGQLIHMSLQNIQLKQYIQYQYQMNENQLGDTVQTVFQVVRNPNWITAYIGCVIVTVGLLYQFVYHLWNFSRKRKQKAEA